MDKSTYMSHIVNALTALGGIVGALATIGGFVYAALFRPFRKFLRNEIVTGLTDINKTLTRTEERLIAHITNPVAHQSGEYNVQHPADSSRSESDHS